MSSISRVLRSRLKQPDGPGEYFSDEEGEDAEEGRPSGRNHHRHGGKTDSTSPGGSSASSSAGHHDNSKHSIDDILGNDKGIASDDGE